MWNLASIFAKDLQNIMSLFKAHFFSPKCYVILLPWGVFFLKRLRQAGLGIRPSRFWISKFARKRLNVRHIRKEYMLIHVPYVFNIPKKGQSKLSKVRLNSITWRGKVEDYNQPTWKLNLTFILTANSTCHCLCAEYTQCDITNILAISLLAQIGIYEIQ